jgi:hypothetical protein
MRCPTGYAGVDGACYICRDGSEPTTALDEQRLLEDNQRVLDAMTAASKANQFWRLGPLGETLQQQMIELSLLRPTAASRVVLDMLGLGAYASVANRESNRIHSRHVMIRD